jgi:hypoxanthine-guanine phosphoribosyltransferase
MRENAVIVASLLTWSRDSFPLLRYPSVYSCCLATNEARRLVTVRFGSVLLGSARRKHHFVYCCVIAGAYFDVTILAWRKYSTISLHVFIEFMKVNAYKNYAVYSETQTVIEDICAQIFFKFSVKYIH